MVHEEPLPTLDDLHLFQFTWSPHLPVFHQFRKTSPRYTSLSGNDLPTYVTSSDKMPFQVFSFFLLFGEGNGNPLQYSCFLEKEMATHSSILAQRILWTEEPGGLLFMRSKRVRHDGSDLACMHALENEMATHSSTLAWRTPGTQEPGGLPPLGSHRVGHN